MGRKSPPRLLRATRGGRLRASENGFPLEFVRNETVLERKCSWTSGFCSAISPSWTCEDRQTSRYEPQGSMVGHDSWVKPRGHDP
jgi:hypothetical protein